MKTLKYYGNGIVHTFETLFKGKFLIFFLPGLLAGLALFSYYAGTQSIRDVASSTEDIPYIGGVIYWIVGGIGSIIDFIVDQIFQFVVLVCFSPFNCILAEKYDTYITGNKFDGGLLRIINDVLRAIFIVFMLFIMEWFCLGLWWLLMFMFPFGDTIEDIGFFIIPAFFLGFALFDYALERYNIGVFGTIGYGFTRMLTMIVAGSLFILILKIPYVGIILAPVITTMVTTYVYVHRENKVEIAGNEQEIINAALTDDQAVQETEE